MIKKLDNMIYTGDNTILYILLGVVIVMTAYLACLVFQKPKKETPWTVPPAASVRLSLDWGEENDSETIK